jgi:hypothetical protein
MKKLITALVVVDIVLSVAAVITNVGEEYILERNSAIFQSLSITQEEIRNSGSNKKTQVNNMTK